MSIKNKSIKISETLSLDFIYVKGGIFEMGDDNSKYGDEKPGHQVKVNDFYMAKYQLTQELWQFMMKENPSGFKGEKRPVENVSCLEVREFIEQLNNEYGKPFRLPTEAEWEYAARGGIHSQGYLYSGSDKLKQVGWYEENSREETHDVGKLRPNELGLYDMSGNVWEWCADWFDEEYYQKCKKHGLVEDPCNESGGARRVLRGGGYFSNPISCRCTRRSNAGPGLRGNNIGFRLVLPLQSVG